MKTYNVTIDFNGIQVTFILKAPYDLRRDQVKNYLEGNAKVLFIREIE